MADSRYNTYGAFVRFHRQKPYRDLVSSRRWKHFISKTLENAEYKVSVIPAEMEFRPDIIAQAAYGDDRLWWLVCSANAIIDPNTELVAGKQIKLPLI